MLKLLVIAVCLGGTCYTQDTIPVEDCESTKNHPIVIASYRDAYGPNVVLYCKTPDASVIEARITGYYAEPGKLGALGGVIRPGGTVAVSRNCSFMLGRKVHIDQHGVFEVNDLTAEWIQETFEGCTVDIAKASEEEAKATGNRTRRVTILPDK